MSVDSCESLAMANRTVNFGIDVLLFAHLRGKLRLATLRFPVPNQAWSPYQQGGDVDSDCDGR